MLEMICKELGIEIGEEWENDVGDTYKLTKEGLFYEYSLGDWEEVSSLDYIRLLKGELKPKWKPKDGERYYIPDIFCSSKAIRFDTKIWGSTEDDIYSLNNKLVFPTPNEAIARANEIIKVLKNE